MSGFLEGKVVAVTGAGRRAPASRGATKSGAKKAATKATPAKKAAARTTGGTGTRRRPGS